MNSRFTRWAAGAAVALSLFAGAGMAQASSLTSTQVSAILSLLQSFGADQGTINSVSAALGGSTSANASCLNLSNNLTLGSSGSDVTSLQNYLINKGDLTGTSATGYYGYLTASAVGQLQVSLGIVSSQSDSAYGIMGPRTRAAVGCGGTTVSPAQPVQPTQPVQPSGVTPSATIDQSSLTTTSGGPTITGTASGVSSVYITVTAGTNQAGTATQTGNGQVSVVNGHWNVTIYPKADVFTAGVYSVSVYTTIGGTLLTTGTLSILGNALQSTAAQTNPVIINSFTVSPTTVTAGQSVTFSWSSNLTQNDISQNGGGCYVSPATNMSNELNINSYYGSSGTFVYVPTATATYTLNCSSGGKDGSPSAQQSLTITVSGNPTTVNNPVSTAPTCYVSTSPTSVLSGQQVTLTWGSTNATYMTIGGSAISGPQFAVHFSPNGTQAEAPPSSLGLNTYTLDFANGGGQTASCSTSVSVSN